VQADTTYARKAVVAAGAAERYPRDAYERLIAQDVGHKGRETMRTRPRRLVPTAPIVALALWAALAGPAAAQPQAPSTSDDPLLGTWVLDVAKSRYSPGPPPQNQMRSYEKHRLGIRATVKTVQADGRSTTVQSVYDFDNMEYPVTGSEDVDSIVMKRIDAYIAEATLTHAGREIGTLRRVIAKDGKSMTVTLQRTTPPANNVEVYEKISEELVR
jgi:hypothetical protein